MYFKIIIIIIKVSFQFFFTIMEDIDAYDVKLIFRDNIKNI